MVLCLIFPIVMVADNIFLEYYHEIIRLTDEEIQTLIGVPVSKAS